MTEFEQAFAVVRAQCNTADRALRHAFAADAELSARALEQHFGTMLDAVEELAVAADSQQLLGHVETCRDSVQQIARRLRASAQAARY